MERRPVDWFADSGATQHMTDQRDLLINFVPVGPEQWNVSGIGGTSLPVIGKGDVIISSIVDGKLLEGILTEKFSLLCYMLTQYYFCVGLMRGVLLVRGLGANLCSIGTATDTGIEVFFSNNTVSFTRNGVVLNEPVKRFIT